MRLLPHWRKLIRHAWSVRFLGIAFVLSGVEAALPMIQPYCDVSPTLIAGLTGLATAGAFISGLIGQKEFEEVYKSNGS